jgi:hypothetical protein
LRAAGITAPALIESFLEVDSLAHAAEELMNEATFRAHLESPIVTHLGVGVAREASGRMFITITYAELPPRIDALAVARCIADAIEASQGSRVDVPLSRVARHYAEQLASGGEPAEVWPEIDSELDDARHRYEKIGVAIAATADVAALDPRDLMHGQPANDIGVGVAQSPRYSRRGGITSIVVFLALRAAHPWSRPDRDPLNAIHRACLASASGRTLPPGAKGR